MKRETLFVGAAVAMAVMFGGAVMMFNASQSGGTGSAATMATLDRAHAATMGPADAPVVIAEFLDPACETCALFYPAVKELMADPKHRHRTLLALALDAGFNSKASFNRVFKDRTGLTPSAYRRRLVNDDEANGSHSLD